MKYTAEKILNAIKRYPEDKPNHGEHIWMQSLSRDMWMSFIGNNSNEMFLFHENSQNGAWFIDIPGAPEELRPLPYPQNKPEKQYADYIVHLIAWQSDFEYLSDEWTTLRWYEDNWSGCRDRVDFFINLPLEEEECQTKRTFYNTNKLQADKSHSGASVWLHGKNKMAHYPNWLNVSNDELIEFEKHHLNLHGYDIIKRQPEIAPCPFCGNPNFRCEVMTSEVHNKGEASKKSWVECIDECGYQTAYFDTPEEAIEKHNQIAGKEK